MEFFNILYVVSISFILFVINNIPMKYYLFVMIHFIVIFLLNDVLFSAHYMPDQFRYFNTTHIIRDSLDFMLNNEYSEGGNLLHASLLFAIFPMPYIVSLTSLSLSNFMLYFFVFIFLYNRDILRGKALWFYLLFPSLLLYSGLALRDIWIFVFMISSIYLLYKKHLLFSIILALPLLLIKPQNFYIYILSLIAFKIVRKGSFFSFRTLLKLILSIGLFYAVLVIVGVEAINEIRYDMYLEDRGKLINYIPLVNYNDLIFQGTIGALYMVLKPLPWESSSPLQFFQSIENIFIFYFIVQIIKEQLSVKDEFINFLIVYFFIAMIIYGLVTFNYGTAARYRFTFETIFIVFSFSILHFKKLGKK